MTRRQAAGWLLASLVALLVAVPLFNFTGIDLWIQDHFFNPDTGRWLLGRHEQPWRFLLYDGIKKLFILLVLGMVLALVFLRRKAWVQQYRRGMIIVVLSALLVPLVIGGLKASTNMPCPRNLAEYGGNYPHVSLFSPYPADFQQTRKIKCYPAGHASGGFALLSLFFLFKTPRARKIAVASALALGWTIGGYKMLIGDHFFSHTVVTMILAWIIVLLVAWVSGGVKAGDQP